MLFSIIIPAYNAERFIIRSVNSVLNQTFNDFEVIVINDGSKDLTVEQLEKVHDERLIVITQENQGVSVARNSGIKSAQGYYICFLDSDDEFLPCHLEHIAQLIDNHNFKDFFVTKFCISMHTGQIVMPKTTGEVCYFEDVTKEMFTNIELIWTGCVCIKRNLFEKYGMFEPGVKLAEDTDMWRRVYLHTGIVYSDTVTVQRNRDGSEATKHYTRRYEADPLNRMPMFLSDDTISNRIKDSLQTEYELTKLQVVRSYLVDGKKKEAKQRMSEIDKNRISKKRLMITYLCFCIPSTIIRWCLNVKNQGMYK